MDTSAPEELNDDERRRAKRFLRCVTVSFWEHGTKQLRDDGKHLGTSMNISGTGMFIATEVLLPIDTRVHLQLKRRGYMCVVEAKVMHVRKPEDVRPPLEKHGIGVGFVNVNDMIEELLPHTKVDSTEITPSAE